MAFRHVTVAITGMNAKPDNPGPGRAVAKCLRHAREFKGKIIGLGYDALDPGLYDTEICDNSFILPYPSIGEQAFIDRIEAINAEQRIDVLIPCLDAELPNMIRLQPRLHEMGIKMFLPDADQLRLRNKDLLPTLAAHAGLGCPEIKTITSVAFFNDCEAQGWEYPLVVKGIFYDAYFAHNREEAIAGFRRVAAQWGYPVLVQKMIKGEEINLAGVGDGNGALLPAVMMKKMALTDKGKAWAGVSIDDPRLLHASERLVNAIKWRGPLEVEVMRDPQGQYHLIEINPRFPAWIYLTHGVGRNLPLALLKLIYDMPQGEAAPSHAGTLFIRYAEEKLIPLSTFESVIMKGTR
jgi:carbamoyl-phosphate synthase large subunit